MQFLAHIDVDNLHNAVDFYHSVFYHSVFPPERRTSLRQAALMADPFGHGLVSSSSSEAATTRSFEQSS